MDLDMIEIGQRIRAQREFLGYTREQFAELIGITPKFCADIELGIKGMSLQTLNKAVHTLKLSADFILYGKFDQTKSDIIVEMLGTCPPNKLPYAIEILKQYLMSIK